MTPDLFTNSTRSTQAATAAVAAHQAPMLRRERDTSWGKSEHVATSHLPVMSRRQQAAKLRWMVKRAATAPHGRKRQREAELRAFIHGQLKAFVTSKASQP